MTTHPERAAGADRRPFQARVDDWLIACFGEKIARDREERNHRFIEEALELVQANGCTRSEAHQLVDYFFDRPVGEPAQEVGGVMNTLAALCLANGLDIEQAGETELTRVWTKVEQIRAKQAAKPKHSPLPQHVTPPDVAPAASGTPAQGDAVADKLAEALEELLATVKGECPSLLNEDSGGDARLDLEIQDALDAYRAARSAAQAEGGTL